MLRIRPIKQRNGLPLLAVLMIFLAACSTPVEDGHDGGARPPAAQVTVVKNGSSWSADYELIQDAPVWVFPRSALERRTHQPWRPKQWQVETPGVVLEHHGRWDILRAANGGNVPRHLRFSLTPKSVLLLADYQTLVFSDGSIALYSGAFDLFPLATLADVDKLPDDLDDVSITVESVRIRWVDKNGPVLVQGRRTRQGQTQNDSLYALFGTTAAHESRALVTVTDPALPSWISQSLEDAAPRLASYYHQRLGAGQTDRPMVMITWQGPTPKTTSMGGSVLPGLIVMTLEGDGLMAPTASVLTRERWFIAHESAHFWLGQTVRYATNRDSWITEGGADMMAIRALKTLDPAADEKAELQREVDDCVKYAGKPIAAAATRNEHSAFYGCGAVFAMVAEASQRDATGGDWFDFLKPLIDEHRKDGVLTRAQWLGRLSQISGNPALARDIGMLLDKGSADPTEAISTLLSIAQIPYKIENRKIVLE